MTSSAMSAPRARTRIPAAVALPLLFVSLVALQGCDVVTADLKHSETAEWRKTYELAPGGRVEISNVNGRIEVEPSAGNTVEVVAQKIAKAAHAGGRQGGARAHRDSRRGLALEHQHRHQAAPRRRLVRHGRRAGQVHGARAGRAPRSSSRRSTAASNVTGLSGRVTAETTNGGVVARDISGTIDASTTNGGVDVELARLGEGGAKLECTNGGIRLRLPADAKATISASITNGGIDTSGLSIETTAVVPAPARRPAERRRRPDPHRRHERRHPYRPAIAVQRSRGCEPRARIAGDRSMPS